MSKIQGEMKCVSEGHEEKHTKIMHRAFWKEPKVLVTVVMSERFDEWSTYVQVG